MPPGDRTYADIAADPGSGATLDIDAIRTWITELVPCGPGSDDPDHVLVTRVRAEQIRNALEQQLGVTQADMPGKHRMYSSIDVPEPTDPSLRGYGIAIYGGQFPTYAFEGLGGPDYVSQAARSSELDPSFFRAFFAVSQAWCATSVARSDALFSCDGCADRDATSAAAEPAIRRTIGYQHLRLLAETAPDEDVEAMYRDVYLPYEASSGARVAWTAVCATYLRDPRWLTY
jgi:hypothetical protein